MPGFSCEFVEEPPEMLQSRCSLCQLILREPFQVTCCGHSFCKDCIQPAMARERGGEGEGERGEGGGGGGGGERERQCPVCEDWYFECYPNKGLELPLYRLGVLCPNREQGCEWTGELAKLDRHLNLEPEQQEEEEEGEGEENRLLKGCEHSVIKCTHCGRPYPRAKMEKHQTAACKRRPTTCPLCGEFRSTYSEVKASHSLSCECRLVECPNNCGIGEEREREEEEEGANGTTLLQYRHLAEHVSAHCPLSWVECEFANAGCQVRPLRKDLFSHLAENVTTHLSLLARENRRLKGRLQGQGERLAAVEAESRRLKLQLRASVLPIEFRPFVEDLESGVPWQSDPFYSHFGGYRLHAEVKFSQWRGSARREQQQQQQQPQQHHSLSRRLSALMPRDSTERRGRGSSSLRLGVEYICEERYHSSSSSSSTSSSSSSSLLLPPPCLRVTALLIDQTDRRCHCKVQQEVRGYGRSGVQYFKLKLGGGGGGGGGGVGGGVGESSLTKQGQLLIRLSKIDVS